MYMWLQFIPIKGLKQEVFQKKVKTVYCTEFFRVLSGIQWSPTELLWVVRGIQQRPTNLSIVMTQR